MFELAGKRIWVAGHRGMVGSALLRRLAGEDCETITAPRQDLDLRSQQDVLAYVADTRPDAIILAAAKVGGILANDSRPAEFLHDNLLIESNVFAAAHRCDTAKLLFLGSSCIYPKFATQPITEDALLTGALEATNEAYAIAKIAGIKLADAYRKQYGRDYISAMPCNLYGPGDNFDLGSGHVMPALMRKAHEAQQRREGTLTVWGTGTPRREFLHVDDCADALVFLLQHYSSAGHVNVGSGSDLSINVLAAKICRVVGFEGRITHDLSKPDGTPRKLMSSAKLEALGWRPRIGLDEGLHATYAAFLETVPAGAAA